MIRDGDGKDAEELASSLCRYYEARNREDMDRLPRVTRENVLILKYYSFENYFLDPKIMEKIGVIKSEDDFYEILLKKWNEYLYKLKSGQHLTEMLSLIHISFHQGFCLHYSQIHPYSSRWYPSPCETRSAGVLQNVWYLFSGS